MAGVLLVDGPHDGGVLRLQLVGDGGGIVLGAVVHNEDFHLVGTVTESSFTVIRSFYCGRNQKPSKLSFITR